MEKEYKDKIDKMFLAICGDDDLGVKGIADRVEKNEKYIERDKKMKWTLAGGVGLASSGLTAFIKSLFE